MSNNYIIITPVKNEEKYIKFTLDSVLDQTILPAEWIIVNDGSTDRTAEIVEQYCTKSAWIKLINIKTFEEQRMGGNKVVRAFKAGYSAITNKEWDFIVKLDGDLTLPNNYFEEIFKNFTGEKKLGICGGTIVNKYSDDKLIIEKSDQYHVRGALKTIRRECWYAIGGFKEVWAWDGLDIMEARFNGWNTKSIDIKVIHHRPTSSAYNPIKQSYRNGYESYKFGNDIILTLVRSFVRFKNKPYFIVGFAFLAGFLMSWLNRESKVVSKDLESFMRKFHYSRIFNFKSDSQIIN
jgi:poly-beta-1,6-N-acetyl-D-glucosamine synthase